MIKVSSQVTIYEMNGKETTIERPRLVVKSHWNNEDFVILIFEDKEITVTAKDLVAAITNATRINRW